MTISWAGEGLCEPKRLDWWRTDVVDAAGGGDLFKRLFPKTHQWAALEAVRSAAIQTDRRERAKLAKPDGLRTLFFWGAEDLDIKAKKLAAALLPLADNYPMPMYRIGEH